MAPEVTAGGDAEHGGGEPSRRDEGASPTAERRKRDRARDAGDPEQPIEE